MPDHGAVKSEIAIAGGTAAALAVALELAELAAARGGRRMARDSISSSESRASISASDESCADTRLPRARMRPSDSETLDKSLSSIADNGEAAAAAAAAADDDDEEEATLFESESWSVALLVLPLSLPAPSALIPVQSCHADTKRRAHRSLLSAPCAARRSVCAVDRCSVHAVTLSLC
jgi:hypothetical protein